MKNLIKYYSLFMAILLFLNNIFFESLNIKGIVYQIIMGFLIIINIFILIKYANGIKYKKVSLVILLPLIITAKNILNLYFILTFILVLLIIGFKESIFIKCVSICILMICLLFYYPLLFIFMFTFGDSSLDENKLESKIYEDNHYLCNNNTEVFVASGGAFDKFHYYEGKYYKILNVDDIININIRFNHETSMERYEKVLKTNTCVLVKDE